MAERIDEKILDFINEVEKREAKKDICKGPVKIGERYYEFEEKDFFDEKLKIWIPNDFEEMSEEARKFKYPSENRPEIIKCNENGSIAITLNITDNLLDEAHVEEFKNLSKVIVKRMNPANVFFEDGVLEINNKNIGYFDYKSSAIDDFLYNFMFFLEFEGKALMGTFSCIHNECKEWRDVVFQIIRNIKENNKSKMS
ncbi:hypothetical protein [Clostridium saccharobutylicum]|uniref:Uncharacterized protein n=1 Tax=Clostridium saccharobutylicum DSM 13864 TaxID=1345695 RepID=U5MQ63_CLOSA|nr:hypothetical protein [Clostridium saccharobutylicum]AGX41826.1 hypothetical protein CLSA_c08130 [Clostridium saccharobutylicum DSM 13864]AQR89102.1 hypothetical protein CLOSC_07980 [Clostridium saccharobutylicum]AQR99003.1 hypothetical protein CSACC_08050 [Clostridium saccharobutylicum]AQS12991.1 hypothetical protein CLOSACC_08050 [Clostridium saccharobutylicum]MBA2903891.1 hypothetical protein [Clostridium saccharobutylicum]